MKSQSLRMHMNVQFPDWVMVIGNYPSLVTQTSKPSFLLSDQIDIAIFINATLNQLNVMTNQK